LVFKTIILQCLWAQTLNKPINNVLIRSYNVKVQPYRVRKHVNKRKGAMQNE